MKTHNQPMCYTEKRDNSGTNSTGKFSYIEHPHNIYIQALEELLHAYCQERKLRPIDSISQEDAKYAVGLKHRVRKLISE